MQHFSHYPIKTRTRLQNALNFFHFLFTKSLKYGIITLLKTFSNTGGNLLNNVTLEKRYGLFTAICMVVGIVIGSGVFFKAQDVLNHTNGNMWLGILAWIVGGAVMMLCAYTFGNFATRYVKVNGIVDYAEAIVGERYAYLIGWFISTVYFPAMTSVLAWVSARYTLALIYGVDSPENFTSGLCMGLGAFYLCLAYVINMISPKIAGKFQIASTVIKLIPLGIMVIVGTIAGLINGNTSNAFAGSATAAVGGATSVFKGIAAAAFAYEGWIIATSINAEIKDAKRNLPRALIVGTALIMIIYVTYFIGLTGGASVETLMTNGALSSFLNLFGNVAGSILNAFIVVSCLGTLNGLMLASTRSLYSVAVRGHGPSPQILSQVDPSTNMPSNSGVLALGICAAWFFYFFAANLNATPAFGLFSFDSSELPIITIYALYIPIFILFIKKEGKKAKGVKAILRDVVMPALALLASCFMVAVAVLAHGVYPYLEGKANEEFSFPIAFYLIIFAAIMTVGMIFYRKKNKPFTS